MDTEAQEVRAQNSCGRLYQMLTDQCDIVMDDEKYFKLFGNNVMGNRYFYSIDPSTAPSHVKFQKKAKLEPKVLIWMAISSKEVSNVYVS